MTKFKQGEKLRMKTMEGGSLHGFKADDYVELVGYWRPKRCIVRSVRSGIKGYIDEANLYRVFGLDHLQPGDLIDCSDGDTKKVIDVLPNSALLSNSYNHEETDDFWSIAEMEKRGWTVQQPEPTQEVTELSVAELEEKLGLKSGSLRVKKD